jgi:hypothetical protein
MWVSALMMKTPWGFEEWIAGAGYDAEWQKERMGRSLVC